MANAPVYTVYNAVAQEPKMTSAVARVADFSTVAIQNFDFDIEYTSSGKVNGFQSVWVDNSNNSNSVTIETQGGVQSLKVPGQYQGVLPLFILSGGRVSVSSTVGAGATTKFLFLTMPQDYALWPSSNASAVGAATAANQATQIARADTANSLLQDIENALIAGGGDATAANQATIIGILNAIGIELSTIANEATLVTLTANQAASNTKLDAIIAALATTLLVKPVMALGGNISVQTNASGALFAAFANQAARQMTIYNKSGTAIEFRQGGAGVSIPLADGEVFTVMGITNTSDIGVHRVDNSNTQVTVLARWES